MVLPSHAQLVDGLGHQPVDDAVGAAGAVVEAAASVRAFWFFQIQRPLFRTSLAICTIFSRISSGGGHDAAGPSEEVHRAWLPFTARRHVLHHLAHAHLHGQEGLARCSAACKGRSLGEGPEGDGPDQPGLDALVPRPSAWRSWRCGRWCRRRRARSSASSMRYMPRSGLVRSRDDCVALQSARSHAAPARRRSIYRELMMAALARVLVPAVGRPGLFRQRPGGADARAAPPAPSSGRSCRRARIITGLRYLSASVKGLVASGPPPPARRRAPSTIRW